MNFEKSTIWLYKLNFGMENAKIKLEWVETGHMCLMNYACRLLEKYCNLLLNLQVIGF